MKAIKSQKFNPGYSAMSSSSKVKKSNYESNSALPSYRMSQNDVNSAHQSQKIVSNMSLNQQNAMQERIFHQLSQVFSKNKPNSNTRGKNSNQSKWPQLATPLSTTNAARTIALTQQSSAQSKNNNPGLFQNKPYKLKAKVTRAPLQKGLSA